MITNTPVLAWNRRIRSMQTRKLAKVYCLSYTTEVADLFSLITTMEKSCYDKNHVSFHRNRKSSKVKCPTACPLWVELVHRAIKRCYSIQFWVELNQSARANEWKAEIETIQRAVTIQLTVSLQTACVTSLKLVNYNKKPMYAAIHQNANALSFLI